MRTGQIVFFLLLMVLKIFGQNPVCYTINTVSGFSSNNVYDIIQDKAGFIWIAHDKGLSRYDGFHFKDFETPTNQGPSLSNLLEINKTIWCQDFTGKFYQTRGDVLKADTDFIPAGIYIPAGVNNKNTIVSISNKAIRFKQSQGGAHSFLFDSTLNISGVHYADSAIHFFVNHFLYRFKQNTLSAIRTKGNIPFFFLLKLNGSFYGVNKSIFPYLFRLEDDNWIPVPILPEGQFIQSVQEVGSEIWIGTTKGAYCFDKNWNPKYNGQCFFEQYSISKILRDRESNYWFGTLNNGLIVVPDLGIKLFTYKNEGISALALQNDQLIAGTFKQKILSFNVKTNQFSTLYEGTANHEVLDIYPDKNNRIVFCSDKVIYLDNKRISKQFSMAGKSIASIGEFYAVAISSGICLIRKEGRESPLPEWLKVKGSVWRKSETYNLTNFTTRGRGVAFNVSDSTLYAATSNGLYYFSPAKSGELTYKDQQIFVSEIKCHQGKVYFATFNQGVFVKSDKQPLQKIENPRIIKGLTKIEVSDSLIWLLGKGTLQQYNLNSEEVFTYNHFNGIPQGELKDFIIFNHKIFLATSEGLVVLEQKNQANASVKPLMALNRFLVNNQPVQDTGFFEFPSHQNNISIHFSVLSYKRNNQELTVEYKINNRPWLPLTNSRVLSLPSLSPGNYNIAIRAYIGDEVDSSSVMEYQIKIKVPFYKSIWFILIIIAVVITAMYYIFKIRLRSIKATNTLISQKITLENDLQKSILSAIKSQMNPHFIFNALNTIQSYIYTNEKELASAYLSKFSDLTRIILNTSNKEMISLAEELISINLYLDLEKIRFEEKLVYHIDFSEELSAETSFIPPMLIQPYIENAIKHGLLHKKGPWSLFISFYPKKKGVEVIIDDNGIGRKKSAELNYAKYKSHQSFSSVANAKRLEILNKGLERKIYLEIVDKEDANHFPEGTMVRIYIPFIVSEKGV